ncbi:hypothetical protein ACX1C1_02490 [Paenibacillus sp. strain BS8-2]
MLKKIIGTSFCFFFLLATAAFASVPNHVEEFAKHEGLKKFKEILSEDPSSLMDYGYSDIDELDRAELGEGFQVHIIDPEKLQKANASTEIQSIIKKTDQWEYIVLVDGFPKSLLGVGIENGKWSVTKAGGYALDLAKSYDEMTALNPKEKPILFYAQGIPIFLSKKDNTEIISTELLANNSKLLPNITDSNLSTAQALISNLQLIQSSPNQNEDSGGKIASSITVNNEQSTVKVITISAIVALMAAFVIYLVLAKKTAKKMD